ncbi:hypothetical protein [Hyphococcus luteus]|uniref:Uncharacterized protein n=1 Tax=Hyphococcus luteus TaxID=2058213 RepID=A0A2S7K3U7_9PROT|nr:hypothetical protein [Marinicaulis flavus]PQA87156.1 hypothetical protein CW354_14045 [Marinicaulis flavus]
MTGAKTRPLTIRLPARAVERLHERANIVKGRPTAIARELILAGLINGHSLEQAERMLTIERRLAAIDQQVQAVSQKSDAHAASTGRLLAMFEALLQVLTGEHSKDHSHLE